MKRPWMPLYVADYRANTAHLSTIQHGAYLLLIMHYWTTGSLPTTDDALARIAGMTPSEWRKARPTISAFFSPEWKHKRIETELGRASFVSESNSSKARGAANRRWGKDAPSNAPSNAPDMPQASPEQCSRMHTHTHTHKEEDYPAGAGPSSTGYAFEFGCIKLKKKDFDAWTIAFSYLDLRAELIGLEPWAAQQSNWFIAVSQALNKKNREAKFRIDQAKNVPQGQAAKEAEQFKKIEEIMRQKGRAVVFADEVPGGIPGLS